jgi:uncharacterized membrane protein
MRSKLVALALFAGVALAGCSDMTTTQQRTLSGAGIGAAAGTVVGAMAGETLWGAAIGTAAGAAGGYLYDSYKKHEQQTYEQGYAAGKASASQ